MYPQRALEGFNGEQLSGATSLHPIYTFSMQSNPATNFIHQVQQLHQNFTTNDNLMMHQQVPMHHQATTQHLNYHQAVHNQYLNYQVAPEEPVPQQSQQLGMHTENGEEVVHVEMEPPLLSSSGKPRLRWTWALHSCFLRAALHLGGIHSATPKKILQNMNVRGLTIQQIKSHLQKVRHRYPQGISVEELMAYGIEAPGHGGANGVVSQAAGGNGTNVEALQVGAPEQLRMLGGNEVLYSHPNYLNVAPAGFNNFSFTNF